MYCIQIVKKFKAILNEIIYLIILDYHLCIELKNIFISNNNQ